MRTVSGLGARAPRPSSFLSSADKTASGSSTTPSAESSSVHGSSAFVSLSVDDIASCAIFVWRKSPGSPRKSNREDRTSSASGTPSPFGGVRASRTWWPLVRLGLRSVRERPRCGLNWSALSSSFGFRLLKADEALRKAAEDILAFGTFPKAARRQVWTNNPQKRLNRETRRRTDVAGVLPNREAIVRLAGGRPCRTDRRVDGVSTLHDGRGSGAGPDRSEAYPTSRRRKAILVAELVA